MDQCVRAGSNAQAQLEGRLSAIPSSAAMGPEGADNDLTAVMGVPRIHLIDRCILDLHRRSTMAAIAVGGGADE